MKSGSSVELSLARTLFSVREIKEIHDPSPLVTVALHRFLLAVLHRVFGPSSKEEWGRIWQEKTWDNEILKEYLARWRGRFDLFDEEYPFYQAIEPFTSKESPASRLFFQLSSGNNPTLFDHTCSNDFIPFSPSQMSRAIIAHQAFALGGGRSPTGYTSHGPLVGSIQVLIKGDNLFETLMFNLIRYDVKFDRPIPAVGDDYPTWEKEGDIYSQKRVLNGYLDLLTWQSRMLRLIPERGFGGSICVKRILYGQGYSFSDPSFFDPQIPAFQDEKRGWLPLRLSQERALWRDSPSLLSLGKKKQHPPESLSWLANLIGFGYIEEDISYYLSVYGMLSDRAKILLWRQEELPLPLIYLSKPDLVEELQDGLDYAEKVSSILRSSLYTLALYYLLPDYGQDSSGKPNKIQINKLMASFNSLALYWSRLELPFYRFLRDLPDEEKEAQEKWVELIRKTAIEALDFTVNSLDFSPRALKACIRGKEKLLSILYK